MFTCQFCNTTLKTKRGLKVHQQTVKYCLKIQCKDIPERFQCKCCKRKFARKDAYLSHQNACIFIKDEKNKYYKTLEVENNKLKTKISVLQDRVNNLEKQLRQTQKDYKDLSLTAVKRPTISNKTMNVNNFIKNMQPLTVQDIENSVPMLTLEQHAKGAEGYFPEEILSV